MRVTACIVARIGSTRLERKVLRDLAGLPLVEHIVRRSARFPGVSNDAGVVMAIPDTNENDELVAVCENLDVICVRGDENNVLSRILKAAGTVNADAVYRVTADNPFVDPGVVEGTWNGFVSGSWDYAVMEDTPLGTTAELVTVDALNRAVKIAGESGNIRYLEHPTLALYENSADFAMNLIPSPEKWRHPDLRLTVDTIEDFRLVEKLMSELGIDATLDDIVPYVRKNPEILAINSSVSQQGWDSLKQRKDSIRHV